MIVVSLRMEAAAVPLVLAAFLAGIAALSGFALMSGRPALELDERGMTLNTLLTSKTVAWADVANIKIDTMNLYYLGFIPVSRHSHLIVKTTGSWFKGNKIRVSTLMMALPPGGLPELLSMIEAARAGAGGMAVRGRTIPAHESASSGPGFDPDAAIASYLARKAESDAQPPAPPRPTFGRKQV
jgi:hypothetical protein